MGNSWEEDVVVVGNIAEVAGIQTEDSPVDAQIGSWVVDNDQRKHGRILEVVDDVVAGTAGGADQKIN